MSDEEKIIDEQPVADSPAASPEPTVTLTKDELKNIVSSAVSEAIKSYKPKEERVELKTHGNKMSELISNTQSELIQPAKLPNEKQGKINLVNNILTEYNDKKQLDSLGKVLYPNDEEGLFKTKIVLMKKMGMSPEDIADIL